MKDIIPHALWITPHFTSEMKSGEVSCPYVDYGSVDWEGLLKSLEDIFKPENGRVKIRIANDSIDQVTIHMKQTGQLAGTIECFDFGEMLQAKAKLSKNRVIPIQEEWKDLHFLKNRRHAPPPLMIPLVISGQLEDIIFFVHSICMHLGITAAFDVLNMINGIQARMEDFQGHLSQELMDLFETHFGLSFETFAIITPLVKIDPSRI
tara:strand:+ start:63993 stop:64613 length:621 start_codon:yes stop_codon:yes gene_type:complete